MAVYVLATSVLFQRGSGDSKDPDGGAELVDEDPRGHARDRDAPWPVRRGGVALRIYNWSLSVALLVHFAASFVLHACASARSASIEEQALVSGLDVLARPRFWFESFQNWQSEFLSIAALVVFTIFLRQRGSLESKPVHFAHGRTGRE